MKNVKKTVRYYDKQSDFYDSFYNTYLTHTHQMFLERIKLQPEHHILDISAGTGLLAEKINQKFGPFNRLVLNDPSEKMLSMAKSRLQQNSQSVSYTNFFAEEPDFKENSFDHVLCLNSFHYYSKQTIVINNMSRILKPGGILWMLDWNRTGFFIINNKLIDWFSPMHINTRSLGEMKTMLTDQKFSIKESEHWHFRLWNFFFVKAIKNTKD